MTAARIAVIGCSVCGKATSTNRIEIRHVVEFVTDTEDGRVKATQMLVRTADTACGHDCARRVIEEMRGL